MTHPGRAATTAVLVVIAFALFVPGAAAQDRVPVVADWRALPHVVPEGAMVVVKTRDGHVAKGRLRSLSATAIVLEGGRLRTIPAAGVVAITGADGKRQVKRGAGLGLATGLSLSFWVILGAGPQDTPCSSPEECDNRGKAVYGTALALPALGAGIGAVVGALRPGKPTLFYTAPGASGVSFAPVVGRGRRGAAVRVAF